jgi:thymidylate synthase
VEVVGIINGRKDSAYLNFFNPRLPRFAGTGPVYHGACGHRLRHNVGFDQLEGAAEALRNNPNGRQVVLQIWDAELDFPQSTGEADHVTAQPHHKVHFRLAQSVNSFAYYRRESVVEVKLTLFLQLRI